MSHPPQSLPWSVAVPVKRSDFTPLRARDAPCNVEVDLSRIGAFSNSTTPMSSSEVLFADLQISPDVNANCRLGSGRSGVFADRYVKGVGRTLLAGNWNRADDLYHNSGLQLASAGAREYLVSEYVKRLGLAHTIVPCEGLLVRRLPAGFGDHLRRMYGSRKIDHDGFDTRLQMISHKPTGFARYSNFVWWLSAFPQEMETASALASMFQRFDDYLAPTPAERPSPGADDVAERFARAVLRGIDNFIAAWRAGITWGSVSNNYTADGRFLDLETPSVLGGSFLGCQLNSLIMDGPLPVRVGLNPLGRYFGLEVVRYVNQVRTFAQFLLTRLQFLAGLRWTAPVEAQFINQFTDRLRWHLRHTCPLLRERAMCRLITDKLAATLEPTRTQRQLIHCMVSHAFEGPRFLDRARGPAGFAAYKACTFVRLDLDDITPIEPGVRLQLYVPAFLRERVQAYKDPSQAFHDALRALNRSQDVDDCLETMTSEARRLGRLTAPT